MSLSAASSLITLLTDFGTADYFVGAMKGAILSINSRARIFDITHDVPPHGIRAGAFTLFAAYRTYPKGTVHVAVVDPGVGSARRPILVKTQDYHFVGPDNGLFSFVYEREKDVRVFHLTDERYFRQPVSPTFHGRDIFAPIAAALTNNTKPEALGREIEDYVRFDALTPKILDKNRIEASIINIDRFGNCVTNLTAQELTESRIASGARIIIGNDEIKSFRRFFAEGVPARGELFAVWGSAGFLEIVAYCDSAARLLDVQLGQTLMVCYAL